METIQKFFIGTIIIISLIIEETIRIALLPLGIILTIAFTICGFATWVKNNQFLDFCSPWKISNCKYFPITCTIADWLNQKWLAI